jgi:dTDP-glucose 4,6-dehydratase
MEKILVTGADGFIGSHLVETLVKKGHSVRAFCLYNSFSSIGWLRDLDPEVLKNVEIVLGDIRDFDSIGKSVKGVDKVFHLAALIAIPYSYVAPESYVDTNIKGTLNVLRAALAHNINQVVHTSTSEVYGTAQYVPITENHPLIGQSPYSASKIGADQIAYSFYSSYGLPVSIVRPFNTYGPRQSARAVIPTIITQMLGNNSVLKLGNLDATRDF